MYPKVKNIEMVGKYSAVANAGGGYVWDEVLEYKSIESDSFDE